jgi:hypothetical protein
MITEVISRHVVSWRNRSHNSHLSFAMIVANISSARASDPFMNVSVLYALVAAALFGASTPLAKLLGVQISPILLAGLLYLGSGLGLTVLRFARDRGWQRSGLGPANGRG